MSFSILIGQEESDCFAQEVSDVASLGMSQGREVFVGLRADVCLYVFQFLGQRDLPSLNLRNVGKKNHAACDPQISGRNSSSVRAPLDLSTNRRLSFADGRRFSFPGVRHFNCARYPGLISQAIAKALNCSALRHFR